MQFWTYFIFSGSQYGEYFEEHSKDLKVFLMVEHQKTKEISIRSDLSMEEVKKILSKKQLEDKAVKWASDEERGKFPKSLGPLEDVLKDTGRLPKLPVSL